MTPEEQAQLERFRRTGDCTGFWERGGDGQWIRLQGKEAIDDQVLRRHVQLTATDDLHQYCESLLRNVLKSGQVVRVDSPPDFVASCEDEGRVLIGGQ